jgi:DNA-binding transcriptional ArsR family regulator
LGVTPASAAFSEHDRVDLTLAALADPVRRRSVELLALRPRRAGELAEALGVSPPVMSRHLGVLRRADLVEEEHPPFDARVRVYSLRAASMSDLKAWLADAEAGWTEQLRAFKDHVEGA